MISEFKIFVANFSMLKGLAFDFLQSKNRSLHK
jgi:hypothetical protein